MIIIDGKSLNFDKFNLIVNENIPAGLDKKTKERIIKSRKSVEKYILEGKIGYGINTGFGKLANVKISAKEIKEIQNNIILSHSAGVGKPLDEKVVRGAILIRLNAFAKGYSGVRLSLVDFLLHMLNKNVIPFVPSKGSVGASGDLAPSSHIGLVVMGRGYAYYKGKLLNGKTALKRAGLTPISLEAKEGLSMINGTQFMTSSGVISISKAYNLKVLSDIIAAVSLESVGGRREPFSPEIQNIRGYKGPRITAKRIRNLLKGSKVKITKRVQDPYSFRCIPQVHGAVEDILTYAVSMLSIEMNAATDNPLVIKDKVLSGGNFHGAPVGYILDASAIVLTDLSSISERRVAQLMDTEFTHLPPFLIPNPGKNSGFMLAQVTAASLVSQNKMLSTPASVDSIPTSCNQEDHVSMGMNAALKLSEIVENLEYVLAIELNAAIQALRLSQIKNISPKLMKIITPFLDTIPIVKEDRELWRDIKNTKAKVFPEMIRLIQEEGLK